MQSDAIVADYRSRKANNTLRAQDNNLRLFAHFLLVKGFGAKDLTKPEHWHGISYELVHEFVTNLLDKGYSIGSVNLALSAIRTYVKLANRVGVLSSDEFLRIQNIATFSYAESKRINEKRDQTRLTRTLDDGKIKPIKKEQNVELSYRDRQHLKHEHPDTPQGRRDRVLMCILLDHGLRCGEVALLDVSGIDLTARTMTFYRPKMQQEQTHELSKDTLLALQAYSAAGDMPTIGKLLRGSRKGGKLTTNGMSERAITARVAELGRLAGKENLSAHDCRHSWTTCAADNGTHLFVLQEAGGWNSLASVRRYVDIKPVSNEGVRLS